MPKVTSYRAQSIVYFEGDKSSKIHILKSGSVVLSTTDIETGESIRNLVQVGEFFGVGSALGSYPRAEDAKVLKDAQIVVLSVPEFEEIMKKNAKLMLRMLKVFSTQLRDVHSKVQSLLDIDEKQVDVSDSLYYCGEYYFSHENFEHAGYAFKKYLKEYPDGQRASKVRDYLSQITGSMEDSSVPEDSVIDGRSSSSFFEHVDSLGQDQIETKFSSAKEKLSSGDVQQAYTIMKSLVSLDGASEHSKWPEILLFYGKTAYKLEKYQDTVTFLSEFAKNNSTHARVFEALFFIGASYRHLNKKDHARMFLQRSLQFSGIDEDMKAKAKEILESL